LCDTKSIKSTSIAIRVSPYAQYGRCARCFYVTSGQAVRLKRKAGKAATSLNPGDELQRDVDSCSLRQTTAAMDAAEDDQDIQLQKAASGLLADFESSLKPFLWRSQNGTRYIRRRVRAREAERILRLVCCLVFESIYHNVRH
jgi:hypothetical protein